MPILPERWQLTAAEDKAKQFKILSGFMNDKRVSELAGCNKPFKRLWISSMEESAIHEGFAALKGGREYDSLYHSALCRAKADWMVDINTTRLFRQGPQCGVRSMPTLAMLVERHAKISGFQKEKYHLVELDFGFAARSDRIEKAEDGKRISAACDKNKPPLHT